MEKKSHLFKKPLMVLNYILFPLIIFVVWWFVTSRGITPPAILPSIGSVLDSFTKQLGSGQLLQDIGISLLRVLQGFAWGSLLGVLMGILMGISLPANRFFSGVFSAIRQIPMLAWIPLIILWFGIGEESKVIIIALGAFFPVLVNTINGIKQIPAGYVEVGRMFKLSRWDMFRKVYFPGALPSIFVGLKLALGFAWMIVVAAELVAASSGIGFRINDARSLMQPEVVLVGMFVIAIVGILMDQILVRVSRLLMPWLRKK